MNNLRVIGLMLSFGLEVFCSQIIFIYIPLMLLFSGDGEIVASVTRALAYIGPVLFGFYIGSIIDRTSKRTSGFLVAASIALLTALFSLLDLQQNIFLTVLYLVFASITTYFLNNLRVTVLPLLIKASRLSNANSLLLIVENVALLAAPAISALMIRMAAPGTGLGLLGLLFFISSLLYLFSLHGVAPQHGQRPSVNFSQSCRLLFSSKQLVMLVIAMMGNNAFVGVFSLYIMIHAYDTGLFAQSEAPYILIASGVGAILSGMLASKALEFFGANRLVLFCGAALTLCGVTPLIATLKASYYIAAFGEGFLSSWLVICVWTMRQRLISPEILGKVTGITSALFKLSMIVSIPLAGWLSTRYGSATALISASLWVLLFIIPLFIYQRSEKQPALKAEN